MSTTLDVRTARAAFSSLRAEKAPVFFDNAGGSQTLASVASAIKQYLDETNVQLGASYNVAKKSTQRFDEGQKAAAEFMGANEDEVVLGPSTTQLLTNLSLALPRFEADSEIILSRFDHEANISPWVRLANLIQPWLKIVWWMPPNAAVASSQGELSHNPVLTAENLQPLLTEKTVMVCMTHTSNILGSIHDIQSVGALLKSSYSHESNDHNNKPTTPKFPKTRKPFLCIDGVAYAPHRPVKMQTTFPDIDFYTFSYYKVFGPHVSVMYASRRAQEDGDLGSICHYFKSEGKDVKKMDLATRLGLAGASYELVASIPKVVEYFQSGIGTTTTIASTTTTKTGTEEATTTSAHANGETTQRSLDKKEETNNTPAVWHAIAKHESLLTETLLQYLRAKSTSHGITIIGDPTADPEQRVAVISFAVKNRSAQAIVEAIEHKTDGRIGCRWGDFYSKRLVDEVLGLGDGNGVDGVVRVSMVHYNTVDEVLELVKVLDEVLSSGL